jgi:hypothetical protein
MRYGALPRVTFLGPGDTDLLQGVPPGVFDAPVRSDLARQFLEDPRHHLAVALDGNHPAFTGDQP